MSGSWYWPCLGIVGSDCGLPGEGGGGVEDGVVGRGLTTVTDAFRAPGD